MMPRTILGTALCAWAIGCGSTGVGNPSAATLSLSISTDDEAEPGAEDPEATLPANVLRHVLLVLGEIRFLPCDAEQEPVVIPGQILVDLATGRVEPEIGSIDVPPSGFCGLDAPLVRATRPPRLAGRSLLFAGLREDGALFLLYASVDGTLQVRARDGVSWGAQEGHTSLVWAYRPRRWLAPAELEDAEAVPVAEVPDAGEIAGTEAIERVIPIDADRHPALLDLIRARLAGRSSIHMDYNDNGRIDLAERGDEAWLGSGLTELD